MLVAVVAFLLLAVGTDSASAQTTVSTGWSWATVPTSTQTGTASVTTTISGTFTSMYFNFQCSPTGGGSAGVANTNFNGNTPATWNYSYNCGAGNKLVSAQWLIQGGSFGASSNPATWQADATNGPACTGSGTTGTVLTDAQLVAVAKNAGFANASPQYQSKGLTWAVAVALAESGAQVDAVNTANDNGTTDRGLWQINSVHAQFDSTKLLTDASYNASAAFQISNSGKNWTPWTTFNNGAAYRLFARAAAAVAGTAYVGSIPCGGDNTGLPPDCSDVGCTVSGQGGSTDQQSVGSCIPSGWDLLNPAAYVKGTLCVFKKMFIPSSTSDAWSNFKQSIVDRPPFSVISAGTSMVSGVISGIRTGNQTGGPDLGSGDPMVGGARLNVIQGLNNSDCAGGDPFGTSGSTSDTADCQAGLPSLVPLLRNILRVGLWVAFIFVIWRRASAALGAHTEADDPQ